MITIKRFLLVLTALTLAFTTLFATRPVSAARTLTYYPNWQSGNAQFECSKIGLPFGTKVNDPASTTYTIDQGWGQFTLTWNSTFNTVDWSSTFGIDAVIMKAGTGANVYSYNPEATSDTGLMTPEGKQISHITFCYDFELTASKTANTSYTRTYAWDITKSVAPDSHTGLVGDSFSSESDVVVDQTVTDSDFAVSGEITVNNPTPFTVTFSVSDVVAGNTATVDCPTYTLAPGANITCTYSASLGSKTDGTNTATVTSKTANVAGATASADYTFGDPTNVVGYPTVNVTDSVEGSLGTASGDKTFEYSRDFKCPTDPSMYTNGKYTKTFPNTATIVETKQSDDASVVVTCYAPMVSKTANTSYDRDWNWTISKTGDQTNLTLSTGQVFTVNYEVVVTATKTDSNHSVTGVITVKNPNPDAAMTVSLSDTLPNGDMATITADADCDYSNGMLTVPAGGTATCNYASNGLTGPISGDNVAKATLNGVAFTGKAAVSFGAPSNETDECVDVTDDKYGSLGTVCAGSSPKTFTYSLDIGPYNTCGKYTYKNVASFKTNDNGETGSDDHTVNVDVPCSGGCTLTQGYWKTHSQRGPAPYDDGWKAIGPAEENTTFFFSGKTWYQVFWTAPQGNPYYILAHQYMAAKLNIANGASTTTAITGAISWAETFFKTYTPTSTLSKSVANDAKKYASILDSYNNGYTGPGHCSE